MPRHPHRLRPVEHSAPLPNSLVAIVAVVVAETMLFAGLVGSYLIFRLSAPVWPPRDLPRLPLALTCLNSIALLYSVVPLTRALRAARRDDAAAVATGLGTTLALGTAFLAVQGLEWARLIHHGLTLGGSMYGATFYFLIGAHALHVLAAVGWLAGLAVLARRGAITATRHAGLEMGTIYWYFVCALWVALFALVYVL